MNAAEILQRMEAAGVHLALSVSGSIKTMGDEPAVNRWLATILDHKVEIIAELHQAANDPNKDALPALDAPDKKRILAWLNHIGETDPLTIIEVVDRCRSDFEARRYFLMRASEDEADDRHTCSECANLRREVCTVARPGGVVSARRGYRPVMVKHRCSGFAERCGADQKCE